MKKINKVLTAISAIALQLPLQSSQPSNPKLELIIKRSKIISTKHPIIQDSSVLSYIYTPGDTDPDPNEIPMKVPYTYQVDGYRIAGNVSGTTGSAYVNQAFLGKAVIQGLPVNIPIGTIGLYGPSSAGWEVFGTYSWYFPIYTPGPVRLLFVYHHGYNTTTEWHSALQYASMGPFGKLVNHFGPHDATQGGHYNCWSNLINGFDLPVSQFMAATQVMSKENTSYLGYGNSYLQDVELWSVAPTSYANETFNYDYFIPYDAAESAPELNFPLAGVGLFDYEKEFTPNTAVVSTPVVQKLRNTYYAVTWITPNELNALYGGDMSAFIAELNASSTNIRSAPLSYPEKTSVPVEYSVVGGSGTSAVHSRGGQTVVSYRLANQ